MLIAIIHVMCNVPNPAILPDSVKEFQGVVSPVYALTTMSGNVRLAGVSSRLIASRVEKAGCDVVSSLYSFALTLSNSLQVTNSLLWCL